MDYSRLVERLFNFIIVFTILSSVWYAFLSLIPNPPIDTTPALVMVWSSFIILIIAVFPNILDRVKRFKVKDFEIELREAVAKYTTEDFISLLDRYDYIFSEKDDFRHLQDILSKATSHPSKPVLLVVNLMKRISIPMLFIYLFFLDLIGSSVTIVFISSKSPHDNLTNINKDSILGAISGKTSLQVFYKHFPHFVKIFNFKHFEIFSYSVLLDGLKENIFLECYKSIRNIDNNHLGYPSKDEVLDLFNGQLSCRKVEIPLNPSDLKTIREALAQGDEFIFSIKDEGLNSVISLCDFSKNISKKILADVAKSK